MDGNGEKLEEAIIESLKYLGGEMEEIPLAREKISEEPRISRQEEIVISAT